MRKKSQILFLCAFLAVFAACGSYEETISYENETEYFEETAAEENDMSGTDSATSASSAVSASSVTEEETDTLNTEASVSDIYVAVTGAVAEPGVYIMPEGSRVYEAINAAGGVAPDGDTESVNLVNIIKDGDTVYVATIDEHIVANVSNAGEIKVVSADGEEGESESKVNINTASKEKLMTLTGIGEAKAKAIITYRESHGNFNSIEEIKNVSGIKDGTFGNIKDSITVN